MKITAKELSPGDEVGPEEEKADRVGKELSTSKAGPLPPEVRSLFPGSHLVLVIICLNASLPSCHTK